MMQTAKSIFASNIRKIRSDRNLTQLQAAEICDISLAAIQRLESADRWPEEQTIHRIAVGFQVTEGRLFAHDYTPTAEESLQVLDMMVRSTRARPTPTEVILKQIPAGPKADHLFQRLTAAWTDLDEAEKRVLVNGAEGTAAAHSESESV